MALDKQNVQISFAAGVNTKEDPKQLQGKLLVCQNAVFQTGLELRKVPGYVPLPSLSSGIGIASYNNELISLDGSSLWSYDSNGSSQINKGTLQNLNLQVQTVIRNTFQQTTPDSSVNGTLQCFTWNDSSGSLNYSVFDTATDQSIVNNQVVSATGTVAKVLAVGSYFVIIYNDSTGPALKYKAINIATPTVIGSAVTIASDINSDSIFDATVINGSIYIGYNNTSAHISFYSLSSSLVLSSQTNFGSEHATVINIFGDASFNVWCIYSGNSGLTGFILSSSFATVLGKTVIDGTIVGQVANITGLVVATTATIYYEIILAAVVTGDPLNYVKQNTLTLTGTVGTASVFNRGVGLASKVFAYQGNFYVLCAYESNLQSTYFLINQSSIVVGKVSESLGGGLTSLSILPEFNVLSSGVYQTATLIKDSLNSISGNIYTQTGVQSSIFTFSKTAPSKFVLGNNLHICGALLNMYDGGYVVEHNFNLYPEGLYTTWDPGNPTYSGGIGIGVSMASINQFQYVAVYEWVDNQGQLHQSAPSIPVTVAVNQPSLFTNGSGTLITNGNTITGFSGTAPTPGQYVNLADAGGEFNFPYNCTVVSNVGGTITLSSHHGLVGGSYNFLISNQPLSLYFFESPDPITLGPKFTTINAFPGQILIPLPGTTSNFPAGTYVTSTATVPSNLVPTNNPPSGLGTTFMYYALDNLSIPITVPTLRLTQKKKVSIALYRTQVNGTIFYRTTSPINLIYNDPTVDSIVITDSTADGDLIGNQELYTTGGEIENIAMQASNVATTFKSRALIIPSENPLSLMYSKQVIPSLPVEFNPLEFVQNIDSKISSIPGVFVMDDKIILFGPNYIFYMVGDGPTANGTNNNFSEAQLISSDVGCINQSSIVLMPMGLMFQSQKGIYLLDRSLQVSYIGAEVEGFNNQTVTSAILMETVNQVRFTLSGNTILVYDYFYKQWDEIPNNQANDSCIFQGQFTYINPNGSIYQESPSTFANNGSAVLLNIVSNWMQFDNIQGFQRVYSFLILGTYKSPHTLNVNVYTDFNETPVQQVQIPVLSDPGIYQFRVFMTHQKCQAMKFEIFETQSGTPGEGLSLSNLALIVGVKRGLNKVTAAQSYS